MPSLHARPTSLPFLFPYMGLEVTQAQTHLFINTGITFYSLIWDLDLKIDRLDMLRYTSFYSLIWDSVHAQFKDTSTDSYTTFYSLIWDFNTCDKNYPPIWYFNAFYSLIWDSLRSLTITTGIGMCLNCLSIPLYGISTIPMTSPNGNAMCFFLFPYMGLDRGSKLQEPGGLHRAFYSLIWDLGFSTL